MRNPLQQFFHILYEVGFFLVSIPSRILNAICRGSMHQTFSARVHMEVRRGNNKWLRIERIINTIFFWDEDHCKRARDSEVKRAWRTIELNGDVYP